MNILLVGLFAIYILSPLPLGSNRDWAWLIMAALSFVLVGIWCWQCLKGETHVNPIFNNKLTRLSNALFMSVILWEILQCVPIPISWLDKLPTPTSELYRQAYAIVAPEQMPVAASLSVDASVTAKIALRSTAYFCMYCLLLQVINSRKRLHQLCYVLVISGLFQAAYGSFMTLSGIEYLLGVKKDSYQGYATGTFVARNHFAGYMEMTISLGMGLLLTPERNNLRHQPYGRGWRRLLRQILNMILSGKAVLRLVLVVMVIGLLFSASRMGNVAFFSSLILCGLISTQLSVAFQKPGVKLALFSIIGIDLILLGNIYGFGALAERLEQTDFSRESRFQVVDSLLPMIHDFNWFGSGAGTFKYIFPAYINGNYCCFEHAHNDYLELLSDLGFVGFFCLAGMVVIAICQAITALRHPQSGFARGMGFAALMGLVSLLIHGAMDFNLQIPANAMLFITLMAIPSIALSVYKKGSASGYEN